MIYLLARLLLVASSLASLVESTLTVDTSILGYGRHGESTTSPSMKPKLPTRSSQPLDYGSSPSGMLQVYPTTSRSYIANDLPQGATTRNSYGSEQQTSSKLGAYQFPNGTALSSSYGMQGTGGTGAVPPRNTHDCPQGTGYAAVTSTQTVTTVITSFQTITSTQLSTVTQTSSTTTTITAYVTTTVTSTANLNTGNSGLTPGMGGNTAGLPTNPVGSSVIQQYGNATLPGGGSYLNSQSTSLGPESQAVNSGISTSQAPYPGSSSGPFPATHQSAYASQLPSGGMNDSQISEYSSYRATSASYGGAGLSGTGASNGMFPQYPSGSSYHAGSVSSHASGPISGSSDVPYPIFGTKTSGFVSSGRGSTGGAYHTSLGANTYVQPFPASSTNPMTSIAKGTGLPNSSNYQYGSAPPYPTVTNNSKVQLWPTGPAGYKPVTLPIGSAAPAITSEAGVATPINSNPIDSAKPYNLSNSSHPTNTSTTSLPIPTTCSSPSTATVTGYFDGLPIAPLPTPYLSLNYTTFTPVNATPSEHLLSSHNPRKLSLPTIPDPKTNTFAIGFSMKHLTVSCFPQPANISCTVNIWGLEAPRTSTNGAAAAGIASMSITVPASTVTGIVNGTVGENIAKYGVGVPVDFTGAGWLGLTSLSFEAKIDGPWGTTDGRTGVGIDSVAYEVMSCPG